MTDEMQRFEGQVIDVDGNEWEGETTPESILIKDGFGKLAPSAPKGVRWSTLRLKPRVGSAGELVPSYLKQEHIDALQIALPDTRIVDDFITYQTNLKKLEATNGRVG